MPPRIATNRRSGPILGALLALVAVGSNPVEGQELTLQRDYPGSGPYECPAPVSPVLPSPDERARAGQLATDANQALILADYERVEALLGQAAELDPSSADLAYRRALVLSDLERRQEAMDEFCRSLDLGIEALGVTDARRRLTDLSDALRSSIPAAARDAFDQGILEADAALYTQSLTSFSAAMDIAPEWPEPIFNRGVVNERMGRTQDALRDFRRYLRLVAPDETDAILVSQRIGILEGAASVFPPNPMGALALGFIPGMGHYYTSRPVPGTLTLTTAGMAIAAGFGFRTITTLCLSDTPAGGVCPPVDVVDETVERPYMWAGIGVGAAITLIGAFEAYRKAKARRSEAEAIFGGPPTEGVTGAGLRLDLPSLAVHGDQVDFNLVRVRFR